MTRSARLFRLILASLLLGLLAACANGSGSTTAYGSIGVEAASNRR